MNDEYKKLIHDIAEENVKLNKELTAYKEELSQKNQELAMLTQFKFDMECYIRQIKNEFGYRFNIY